MGFLERTFLENPFWVYVALAGAELAIVAVWYERRSRKLAWMMLAPPVLAATACLLAWAVVTDREQIDRITCEIALDAGNGGTSSLQTYLDANFFGFYQGGRLNKAGAIATCKREIGRHGITRIRLAKSIIEVDGASAEMHVTAVMSISGEIGRANVPVHFRLRWTRHADGWRIMEADDIRVAMP